MTAAPGGAPVLDGVDLEVPAGRLTALAGPSGVGKTTLLRVIAGLEPAEDGEVLLGDRDLSSVPASERRISYMFQRPRLFPNLDVLDNVAFPLRMAGVPAVERRDRARQLLDEVGLSGLERRSPRRLSGGEAQRVALARALCRDPDLLLLDEPLASVDADRRQSLRTLIRRLQRERGLTTVYVTHDRSEAAELGDRIALMLDGRILQHGPPVELFERPLDVRVARFFGAANLLDGRVTDGRFRAGDVEIAVQGADGEATIVVRPEHVRFDPGSPIRGRVTEGLYLGTHDRVCVKAGGILLQAHTPPGASPEPGTEIGVAVDPGRVWRIPHRPTTDREPTA